MLLAIVFQLDHELVYLLFIANPNVIKIRNHNRYHKPKPYTEIKKTNSIMTHQARCNVLQIRQKILTHFFIICIFYAYICRSLLI